MVYEPPSSISLRQDPRSSVNSVQRARRVFTVALELVFICIIGVRTVVAAVLLRAKNLTSASLVSALVPHLRIRDAFHSPPPSFEIRDQALSVHQACSSAAQSLE